MQLPIPTSHRPSIGHHAIGALTATITLAIAGVAVWALAASVDGSGDERADASGAASLVPAAASASVAPDARSVELTVFVVGAGELRLATSWLRSTIDPKERSGVVVHEATAGVDFASIADFYLMIGFRRVVDLGTS